MLDYDVVIVGGGPAGLSAGFELSQGGYRTLVLERELFGGNLKNVDVIEDDPDHPEGVVGAQLATQLAERATQGGVQLREAEVSELEAFSSTRWVGCEGGKGFSANVVIVTTGSHFRTLGLPGEEQLRGRGVIDCTPCDAGFFAGRRVAVCGSDDHAVADALYLAKLTARVTLLTRSPELRASGTFLERMGSEPSIEVRCGAAVDAVLGSDRVEGVALTDVGTGRTETLAVDGVVIRVGTEPNTAFMEDTIDLDPEGWIVTGERLDTSTPYVLAAGDVRSGSPGRVAAAVREGVAAARRAEELLRASG
ncbi:MAG TPA: NAD(P)/FAD-dependent oxidoreductase [Candidatus Binatia bacterium]|nr:NAD(P)/FAD-dependent oxidoreductase [Candidatus Binatia bacterium]